MTDHPVGSLPFDLCVDDAEWHDDVVAAGRGQPQPPLGDGLRALLARVAPGIDHTHHLWYCEGATAGLEHVLATLRAAGRSVHALAPAYPRVLDLVADAPVGTVRTLDHRVWATADSIGSWDADVLYINPLHSNPIGASLGSGAVRDVVGRCLDRPGRLVVEDDAFRWLGEDEPEPILASIPDNTVYVLSLTKVLGLPVPCGAVAVPKACGLPHIPPTAGEAAGVVEQVVASGALEALVSRRRVRLTTRRTQLLAVLDDLGMDYVHPTGGMHLAMTAGPDLARALRDRELGGLPSTDFEPGASRCAYVRIAYSAPSDGAWPVVLEKLREVLDPSGARRNN